MADHDNTGEKSGNSGNVRVYDRPAMADGLPRWVLAIIVLLSLVASAAGAWYFLAGFFLLGLI